MPQITNCQGKFRLKTEILRHVYEKVKMLTIKTEEENRGSALLVTSQCLLSPLGHDRCETHFQMGLQAVKPNLAVPQACAGFSVALQR